MKRILFLTVFLVLLLSACANVTPMDDEQTSAGDQAGAVTMNATATPGSMVATNPEAAHMMEPITAPNVEPASSNLGGQPLDFRLEDGVKVFELTAKAVKWELLP
ncbi:MAG: hypothetical protein KG029_14225, partial [Bacteroidetes bacterium]|nr:hypothetical protein [Bacteroidota bacterium]